MKQWIDATVDGAAADAVALATGLPGPIARSLSARGVITPAEAERFLSPRLSDTADPFLLAGMEAGVSAVNRAMKARKRIVVFADYDADGVTGAVVLVSVLKRLGADVNVFFPRRRDEGYGLTPAAFDRCVKSMGPEMMVTVDCGTGSADVISRAKGAGIEVVVTDHHEKGATIPDCPLVNPVLGTDASAANLAGVGVAFKFCHALLKSGAGGRSGQPDLREFLDLVAVGTVADVVPLQGENRVFVKHGLDRINRGMRAGIRCMLRTASFEKRVDAGDLAFVLGPRVNAAGRMGDPLVAFNLLSVESEDAGMPLADELESANRRRKVEEDGIVEQGTGQIEGMFKARGQANVCGLVVSGKGWHEGAIGIAASRLSARYNRPTVVVSVREDGVCKGSGRSPGVPSILDALTACGGCLETFGGHHAAAGLAMQTDSLEKFVTMFDTACSDLCGGAIPPQKITVDSWLLLEEADERFFGELKRMEPFGTGNPSPVWGFRGLRVMGEPKVVGGKHLRFRVSSAGADVQCIGFRMAEREFPSGRIDVLATMREDNYMGRSGVQLELRDFRPAQ